VQYSVKFYLCPEQGILKSAVQCAILPLPRARYYKKVQYSVQFYLCPEQGIIKSEVQRAILPLPRAGHYKKCNVGSIPSTGVDESRAFHFLTRPSHPFLKPPRIYPPGMIKVKTGWTRGSHSVKPF
jgi:hypothetical protein